MLVGAAAMLVQDEQGSETRFAGNDDGRFFVVGKMWSECEASARPQKTVAINEKLVGAQLGVASNPLISSNGEQLPFAVSFLRPLYDALFGLSK